MVNDKSEDNQYSLKQGKIKRADSKGKKPSFERKKVTKDPAVEEIVLENKAPAAPTHGGNEQVVTQTSLC